MALTGAAAGAATGGLIGVFTNDGVPEEAGASLFKGNRFRTHHGHACMPPPIMWTMPRASSIAAGAIDIDEPAEHIDTMGSPLSTQPPERLRCPKAREVR